MGSNGDDAEGARRSNWEVIIDRREGLKVAVDDKPQNKISVSTVNTKH